MKLFSTAFTLFSPFPYFTLSITLFICVLQVCLLHPGPLLRHGAGDRRLRHSEHRFQVLYSTVLYCTVQYCTVLYCTVLYTWTVALGPDPPVTTTVSSSSMAQARLHMKTLTHRWQIAAQLHHGMPLFMSCYCLLCRVRQIKARGGGGVGAGEHLR